MRENTVRSIFAQTSFGKIYNYIIGYHPTKPKLTHDAKISIIMRCNTRMPIQFLYTTYIIGPPYSSSSCLSVGDSRAKKQGLCLLADKNSLGIVVYILEIWYKKIFEINTYWHQWTVSNSKYITRSFSSSDK